MVIRMPIEVDEITNGLIRARSHCTIFSNCECDSSGHNKWVVQYSMEVFTQYECDNITNSYLTHYNKQQIAVAIGKKRTV